MYLLYIILLNTNAAPHNVETRGLLGGTALYLCLTCMLWLVTGRYRYVAWLQFNRIVALVAVVAVPIVAIAVV